MNKELEFQEQLAKKYKYRKLKPEKEKEVRERYVKTLSKKLKLEGCSETKLYTNKGLLICTGYERVVIGDYGAFIEFTEEQLAEKHIDIREGQEYRLLEKYQNVKYLWMTIKDTSDIKIYLQKNTVDYADYKIGLYYVSPHEVMFNK